MTTMMTDSMMDGSWGVAAMAAMAVGSTLLWLALLILAALAIAWLVRDLRSGQATPRS